MAFLGRLLKKRRSGESEMAWHRPNLSAEYKLQVTSSNFKEGGVIPTSHAGKRVGGKDISPELSWGDLPMSTEELLLVVEDVDVPMAYPFVHCVAIIDSEQIHDSLDLGSLSKASQVAGVTLLRSTIGKGYRGPGPIKGHGPHSYIFQLFALCQRLTYEPRLEHFKRMKPRDFLAIIPPEIVLAKGRLTGIYER